MMRTVFLGTDHAGFLLKHAIGDALRVAGHDVEDLGAHELDPNDDYPEYAERVAHAVAQHPRSMGVLLCGSAEGMCMAANKFSGIRAGVGFSTESARLMRTDDDANILCLPARLSLDNDPVEIVKTFLATPFSGAARHVRRITRVNQLGE